MDQRFTEHQSPSMRANLTNNPAPAVGLLPCSPLACVANAIWHPQITLSPRYPPRNEPFMWPQTVNLGKHGSKLLQLCDTKPPNCASNDKQSSLQIVFMCSICRLLASGFAKKPVGLTHKHQDCHASEHISLGYPTNRSISFFMIIYWSSCCMRGGGFDLTIQQISNIVDTWTNDRCPSSPAVCNY